MKRQSENTLNQQVIALLKSIDQIQTQTLPKETQRSLASVHSQLTELSQTAESMQADLIEEKADFISVVSHELRTPLTSIKGYTDIILGGMVGDLNDQQREFLTIVGANITRMDELISDLRDITRLESGRASLSIENVPIAVCANKAKHNIGQITEASEHTLTINIAEDLPVVAADQVRTVQVMTILLKNAVMYTNPGDQISLRAGQSGKFVRVEIEDNGFGVNELDQPNIFDAFYRSDDSNIREQQGWGLGLNVAWHVVRAMNGEIGFKSKNGRGSIFWFTLPIAVD